MKLSRTDSALLIIDMQPTFLQACLNSAEALERTRFLVDSAQLLQVPIWATEQYPSRMGSTDSSLQLSGPAFEKMAFSACGCSEFVNQLEESGRSQVVVTGIETHICVTQSALDLVNAGFEVFVAADAVTSRSAVSQQIGFNRLRDAGVWVVHSESVVYEWMESADCPEFRSVLTLVKKFSG